jgi:hypothetical protein
MKELINMNPSGARKKPVAILAQVPDSNLWY